MVPKYVFLLDLMIMLCGVIAVLEPQNTKYYFSYPSSYIVWCQNVKCLRATSTMYFPRYQNRSYKIFFMLQEKHPSLFFMEV